MLTTTPTPRTPGAGSGRQPPAGPGTPAAAIPTRAGLAFATQLVLWALRALSGDRACHATVLERVAWSCRTAGVPGAFPALVGLAACLGRGPQARRFGAPAVAERVDPAELAVLLLVRDAAADRRAACTRTAARLVTRPDIGTAIGYAMTIGAELAVAGLPVELLAPVITLHPGTASRERH